MKEGIYENQLLLIIPWWGIGLTTMSHLTLHSLRSFGLRQFCLRLCPDRYFGDTFNFMFLQGWTVESDTCRRNYV